MSDVFLFEQEGRFFHPTAASGSFWGSHILHGGAVSALIGHALEQQNLPSDWRFNRLSIDLLRPVKKEPLSVSIDCIRDGNRLKVYRLEISGKKDLLISASILAQKLTEINLPDDRPVISKFLPGPESLPEVNADEYFRQQGFDRAEPGFNQHMHLRMIEPWLLNGRGLVWMRVPVKVVKGVDVTPLVYACMFSDFGNGIGQLQLGKTGGIVNADIVMHLMRYPDGEWIGIDACTYIEGDGIAAVRATLYDKRGAFALTQHASMPNIQN